MVRAEDIDASRFWDKVLVSAGPDACWDWTASRIGGKEYGKFRVGERMEGAHRVAYALEHGEVPDGLLVCHHCDRPLCCNPRHLFLGTQADNLADRDAKGRGNTAPGTDSIRKLTDEEVMAIRVMLAQRPERGMGVKVARMFGVSPGTVSMIRNGKLWQHVPVIEAA